MLVWGESCPTLEGWSPSMERCPAACGLGGGLCALACWPCASFHPFASASSWWFLPWPQELPVVIREPGPRSPWAWLSSLRLHSRALPCMFQPPPHFRDTSGSSGSPLVCLLSLSVTVPVCSTGSENCCSVYFAQVFSCLSWEGKSCPCSWPVGSGRDVEYAVR